jgi:hypothetical protein
MVSWAARIISYPRDVETIDRSPVVALAVNGPTVMARIGAIRALNTLYGRSTLGAKTRIGEMGAEEGPMKRPGSVRFYLFSGGLGGAVGATGCGSLLTPAVIGMSRQSSE